MYILKNALKCISRAKSRNILIGIIVLVISVSACIGLSIRQASENAKQNTMDTLNISATISFDRTSLMNGMKPPSEKENDDFDRSKFSEIMGQSSSLTLEEYEKYSEIECVKDSYYILSATINGSDDFNPVTNESENESIQAPSGFGGGFLMGGREQMKGSQSDFKVEGVSSEIAMTDFQNGDATITDGEVFAEETNDLHCIISQELATFNDISVGDSIKVCNPNNDDEVYKLKVVGIYTDKTANEESFSMMGSTSTDPANKIYLSYNALNEIVEKSKKSSETVTDSNTGREFDTAVNGTIEYTYLLANTEDYYKFEEEVKNLGLDDSYTVSSADITSYENSLVPLNTLSKMAGYFLIVILLIGAIILIVLNIFNIRERKYEIGVLTAMGMKKFKVALQFVTEIFVVTLVSVIIGIVIGAVSSVPVTNALLENQIASQTSSQNQIEQNFGRPQMPQGPSENMGNKGFDRFFNAQNTTEYISEINNAMNFTVVLQMFGIAILLTLASGVVSMLFVMRYEPLKILANRD